MMRFQAQPKRNRSRTRAAGVLFWAIILPALVALASYSSQVRAELKGSEAFHQEIATHFAFDSNKASQKELDASFVEIDHLVARMKADKAHYLPLLRNELARGPYTPVFATMGPSWLAEMSAEPADLQLAADSLARWTLDQVSPAAYVTVLHSLAARGADVTTPAMQIADWPDFYAALGAHVMPVGQSDAMILLLFSMPEERFVKTVAARLKTETNPTTLKGLLLIAYSTVTAEGTAALEAFAARTDVSDELRSEATKFLNRDGHAHDVTLSITELRQKRLSEARKPVGHDHDRGTVFHELTEAIVYKSRQP